jgi:hypothetical protein
MHGIYLGVCTLLAVLPALLNSIIPVFICYVEVLCIKLVY